MKSIIKDRRGIKMERRSTVKSGSLAHLSPNEISRNPHNPRLIFREESMKLLRDSIKEVGILVPLLVYRRESDGKYFLLDGERRWLCALNLELPKVPVNIIREPDITTNILTMFNIHNVREAWEPMPTALKLEVLMRLLNVKSDQKLAAFTGMKVGNVRRLKKLLTYDKKYQDMMLLASDEEKIKADFFVELYPVFAAINKYLPEIDRKYTRDQIVDCFLEKYRKGVITDVIDCRDLVSMIRAIDKGASRPKVQSLVKRLLDDSAFSIKEAYDLSVRAIYDVIQIKKTCKALTESLQTLELDLVEKDPNLIRLLEEVSNAIQKILNRLPKT